MLQLPYRAAFVFKEPAHASWVRAVLLLAFFLAAAPRSPGNEPTKAPEFARIERVVVTYFAELKSYKPGDLISQSQIRAAVDRVQHAGWQELDADSIVQQGLADDSRLVKQLATPAGRRFMRKIARQPGAYARLDRLNSISRGPSIVDDLIRSKDGEVMLKYIGTTRGGRQLGRQMAAVPQGVDINKPTERIYTAEDLVRVLEREYEGVAGAK